MPFILFYALWKAVLRVLSGKSSKFLSSTHFEQPMECIEQDRSPIVLFSFWTRIDWYACLGKVLLDAILLLFGQVQ